MLSDVALAEDTVSLGWDETVEYDGSQLLVLGAAGTGKTSLIAARYRWLMERGLITALAVNGALAIHDAEIAMFGRTSEDVVAGLQTGTFGMAGARLRPPTASALSWPLSTSGSVVAIGITPSWISPAISAALAGASPR